MVNFANPVEVIFELTGIGIMSGVVLFFIICGLTLIGSYRRTRRPENLLLLLAFLFAGVAMGFLTLERIFFGFLQPPDLWELSGRYSGMIAIALSFTGIVLMDAFAIMLTYPERARTYTVIIAIVVAIAGVVLIFSIATGIAWLDLNRELDYPVLIKLGVVPLMMFPPLFIPFIVFLYYAISIRKQSKPRMKRAYAMSIAFLILAISMVGELAGAPMPFPLIMRIGFFVFAILMYFSFVMPNWYKRVIGWEEEES
ncbi:MAG: hypothetical protein ACTSRW_00715 [Candidatus Helarchaeota archaeon]